MEVRHRILQFNNSPKYEQLRKELDKLGAAYKIEILGSIGGEQSRSIEFTVSEAEVVTFHIPAGAIGDAVRSYRAGTCGGTDNQDCFRETVRLLKADSDAIITEILSLTSTSDTIIRAMEFYNPGVNELEGLAIFEELNSYHAAHNEYLVQACSEQNIPVARVYLAFNGPNGDEDPNDKGYMRYDGIHPNEEGQALIADLHRELGYEPLGP